VAELADAPDLGSGG